MREQAIFEFVVIGSNLNDKKITRSNVKILDKTKKFETVYS